MPEVATLLLAERLRIFLPKSCDSIYIIMAFLWGTVHFYSYRLVKKINCHNKRINLS